MRSETKGRIRDVTHCSTDLPHYTHAWINQATSTTNKHIITRHSLNQIILQKLRNQFLSHVSILTRYWYSKYVCPSVRYVSLLYGNGLTYCRRWLSVILVSPGYAPGVITLSVVWMEREFDAYKLSRCMYSSNYNRFWDTARYLSKIVNFFIPPCIQRPPLGRVRSRWNSATPFGTEKLEWLAYHMVKKFRRYLYSFWRNSRTWRTDRQTDRQTDTGWRQ